MKKCKMVTVLNLFVLMLVMSNSLNAQTFSASPSSLNIEVESTASLVVTFDLGDTEFVQWEPSSVDDPEIISIDGETYGLQNVYTLGLGRQVRKELRILALAVGETFINIIIKVIEYGVQKLYELKVRVQTYLNNLVNPDQSSPVIEQMELVPNYVAIKED